MPDFYALIIIIALAVLSYNTQDHRGMVRPPREEVASWQFTKFAGIVAPKAEQDHIGALVAGHANGLLDMRREAPLRIAKPTRTSGDLALRVSSDNSNPLHRKGWVCLRSSGFFSRCRALMSIDSSSQFSLACVG